MLKYILCLIVLLCTSLDLFADYVPRRYGYVRPSYSYQYGYQQGYNRGVNQALNEYRYNLLRQQNYYYYNYGYGYNGNQYYYYGYGY